MHVELKICHQTGYAVRARFDSKKVGIVSLKCLAKGMMEKESVKF